MSQMTSVSLGTKIVGYHTTSQDNAKAIKAQGFKLDADGFGAVWGKAVYLASDQRTIDYYADLAISFGSSLFAGAQLTTLTVQAALHNPLRLSVGGDPISVTILDALSAYGAQNIKAVLEHCQERELMKRASLVAQELGHDGIIIEHNRFHNRLDYLHTGGNQVVVFDPAQVKVLN